MIPRARFNSAQLMIFISIAICTCIEFGCTNSRIANMWKDPSFQNRPLTNMLVISASKNPISRRLWEDEFVAELSNYSVTSTPSYKLYEDAIPDTDQVETAIREKKYDGILLIRRLPTEITTHYVQGVVTKEAVTRYNRFTNQYYTIYKDVVQPGYNDSDRVVRHEINVWTTGEGGHLVWAGTGETVDPRSREMVRDEVTTLIVPELSNQGIIPVKKDSQ
jgi:hypothetical protein